ncbi:hypothetical protein HK100_005567 [Physocladia obscura]|uniref:Ubiquilin n=1 Tax=Physocladia obscura TaxID=109957 RepID=A0AAD5TAC1_9FUNG|nr:hypothetical protein HK100_005567 [Physocladia obscura]
MTVGLKIRVPSGEILTLQVEADSTFGALKESIAPMVGIAAAEMRVVCAGRILKNDESILSDMGLAEGSTLHVVKMASNSAIPTSPAAASPAAMAASPLGGGGRNSGVPGMPGASEMRQMMNNPIMQRLFDNPDLMAAIMEADPRMRAMAEENPEIRRMIRDPAFLRQMSSAMRNPNLMDEMMRNQDRSLSNIESLPGGMAALSSMYQTMERSERAGAPVAPTVTDESNRRFAERIGANLETNSGEGPNDSALPNPWAVPSSPALNASSSNRLPGGATNPLIGGGFNPLGFPLTNQGASGTVQSNAIPGSAPPLNPFAGLFGAGFGVPPSPTNTTGLAAPDANARNQQMAQQLQMLLQIQQLQQLMQNPNSIQSPSQQQSAGFNPLMVNPFAFIPPPGSGTSSVANPAAPAVPPEERFKDQLASMAELGFTDTQKNIRALLAAGGNVEAAINYLFDI